MSYNSKRVKLINIGEKFGKLTVISQPLRHSTGKTVRAMYQCKCDCGKETWITGSQLRTNKRTRCSDCAYRERPQSTERLSNVERLFSLSILSRCKKGNITNNLTLEEYKNLISRDCYYCGEKPRKISHLEKNKVALREDMYANGVDRIDSSKGYSIDNCVPCCKYCNTMKMNYKTEEFFKQVKKIYEKWIKQEDIIKEKLDTN